MIHDSYLEHVADPSGHLHGCKYVLMVLSERESNGHGDLWVQASLSWPDPWRKPRKSNIDNCLRLPLFLSPGLVVTFCHTFVFHCENLHSTLISLQLHLSHKIRVTTRSNLRTLCSFPLAWQVELVLLPWRIQQDSLADSPPVPIAKSEHWISRSLTTAQDRRCFLRPPRSSFRRRTPRKTFCFISGPLTFSSHSCFFFATDCIFGLLRCFWLSVYPDTK